MTISPREKVLGQFKHREGPVPWLELGIDNGIACRILGREIADATKNIEQNLKDRIELSLKLGIDGIGRDFFDVPTDHIISSTEQTWHDIPLVRAWEDLPGLKFPSIDEQEIRDYFKKAKEMVGDSNLCLFGAVTMCFDPALRTAGFENICLKLHEDREFVEAILDKYKEHNIKYVKLLNSIPEVDFIFVAEDIAYNSGLFISPELFKEFLMPYYREITVEIKKPWVYHSDGDLSAVLPDLISLGMTGIHPFDPAAIDIFKIKKEIGHRITIMGNVDLRTTLVNSSLEEVKEDIGKLMRKCGTGGGYILSSANSITDYVKTDNLLAMAKAKQYWNEKIYGEC